VDQALGELGLAMERRGTWDSSLVLLAADHAFRVHLSKLTGEEAEVTSNKMHAYVPFLLKMPEQKEGLTYDGPLRTIVTQDLILSFLRGELRGTLDIVTWLRDHGEQDESGASVVPPVFLDKLRLEGD
jgi:hypothetical protein